MNLKNMTAEQKEKLLLQLEKEKRAEEQRIKRERDGYERTRDATTRKVFKKLKRLSEVLLAGKNEAFTAYDEVLELKKQIYGLSDERWLTQQSHTFTTTDGQISVVIGHNVIDRWDETVSAGIEKVNKFLGTLAKDDDSAVLVEMIRDLLKPNKDGQLKAARVLDLAKRADEIGNGELKEGVRIIRDAYRPARTSTFLKAKYKDELGKDVYLPLSMSAV